MELNEAWRSGKKAAMDGKHIDDNPFKQDPHKRAWTLGYRAGFFEKVNSFRLPPPE